MSDTTDVPSTDHMFIAIAGTTAPDSIATVAITGRAHIQSTTDRMRAGATAADAILLRRNHPQVIAA